MLNLNSLTKSIKSISSSNQRANLIDIYADSQFPYNNATIILVGVRTKMYQSDLSWKGVNE